MATVEAGRPLGIQRWAGLGGILYVALFIGGALLAFSGSPTGDDRPSKYVSYYGDSGHRDRISVGWVLVVLGVLFFIWFLSTLRQVVRGIDGDGFLTTLVTVGGAIYAALTLAGISVWTAIATMSDDTFHHQVYPGIIHAGNDAGYVLHASGGIAAGTMIIGASLAARRAALIPGWAGTVGVIFGILGFFSIFFFPQALIAIWIIVAGWLLFRAGRPRVGAPPAPGPPTRPA
jgi:hypothetical protein